MKHDGLLKKLERIEEAVNAKGHHMQDYSTFKLALLDIISIIRSMLKESISK